MGTVARRGIGVTSDEADLPCEADAEAIEHNPFVARHVETAAHGNVVYSGVRLRAAAESLLKQLDAAITLDDADALDPLNSTLRVYLDCTQSEITQYLDALAARQ